MLWDCVKAWFGTKVAKGKKTHCKILKTKGSKWCIHMQYDGPSPKEQFMGEKQQTSRDSRWKTCPACPRLRALKKKILQGKGLCYEHVIDKRYFKQKSWD